MLNAIRQFVKEEEGATGVEYALLVVLIALAFWAGATALGTNINTILTTSATNLSTAAGS